jgi:hypothetical protein
MLDYKKLKGEFTDNLNQFDRQMLEQWVSFDQKREDLEKLLNGEKVPIQVENISVSKLKDPREYVHAAGESNYALAA